MFQRVATVICLLSSIVYHLSSVLGISTTVEDSLQIKLFMQNEPNFRKSQMNVTDLLTVDYENKTLGGVGKTNPKRTQSKPI